MDASSRFFTDIASQMSAIELMGRTNGCTVSWLPEGDDQPRTCMKTKKVFLPKPHWKMDAVARELWRAYAHHEFGHHHPSQSELVDLMKEQEISFSSPFGMLINALDDVWQEMVRSREYHGAGSCLSAMQAEMCRRGIKALASGEKLDQHVVDVLGFCYHARSAWQPDVALVSPEFDKYCDYSKWDHLIDRVNGIIDHDTPAHELIAIAREMLEAEGKDPDSEEQKGSPEPDPDGEAMEGEGDDSGDGESDDSDMEEGDRPAKSVKISYEELMGHTHSEDGTEPTGTVEIDYDHSPRDYEPYKLSEFVTGYPEFDEADRWSREMREKMTDTYTEHQHVSRKVVRYFQSASQTRKEYLQKRGKLTTKALARTAAGEDRVFNRKVDRIDNNADVYLLCDASGSMHHRRYHLAGAAITALCEALEAAKVPNRVAAFTEDDPHCYHWDIKKWEDKVDPRKMIERFSAVDLVQNADGDNLMYAYRELMGRSSKRKILIVLSDGQPCCDRSGDAHTYLKKVTKLIESSGNIELYGIGINSDAVKNYYTDYTVLADANEIESCITTVVKQKIIGR